MSKIVAVELLGGIRVLDAQRADCTPKSLKCRLLLAYLSVPVGVRRTRAHLAEVLWPDKEFEQSAKNLRTTLSELRRAIGPEAVVDELGEVSLNATLVQTDVGLLEEDEGQPISMGEFLAGYDYDHDAFSLWLSVHRDQLRSVCVSYGIKRAEVFRANREHGLAKAILLQTIAIEPYSEELHRALIALYIAMGERGLALAQFRTCRDILRRELDVPPSTETIALADRISGKAHHPQSEVSARAELLVPHILSLPDITPTAATGFAVMPFANLNGDAEAIGVVDGIVEDIITDLSKVPGMDIAPRSASMQFRGSAVPPSEKATALNVRYLLEGSLRMSETRLRMSVQLVDTATNRQIWAERYDRDNADIFDVQVDLAKHVVVALRPHLKLPELARRVERTTDDFEAYHLYLRGRELNRGMTMRSIEGARDMFRRALELDPGYLKAMVGEAMAETSLVYHYNLDTGYKKPKATCEYVLKLDPDLPEAWVAFGWVNATTEKLFEYNVEPFNRALELDPNYAEAHYFIGVLALTQAGDLAQAARSYFKAWELDPGDLLTATSLCRALRASGQIDRLDQVEQSTLAIAKRRIGQNPNDFEACYAVAMLLGQRGEVTEARYWAEVASEIGKNDTRTAYFIAGIYLGLGDVETATTHFKNVLLNDPPPARVALFANNPEFEGIRRDPEVKMLIEAVVTRTGSSFKPRV